MKFLWYFVTLHALSYAFVSKYSFLPMKRLKISRANFFKSLFQLSQIWQGKKEIDTRISNSQSQEYWSSPRSHWDTENLYSERALPFFQHPSSVIGNKTLGYAQVSLTRKCIFIMSNLPWQKSCQIKIPFCTMPWFQGDSTFKMRNLEWD